MLCFEPFILLNLYFKNAIFSFLFLIFRFFHSFLSFFIVTVTVLSFYLSRPECRLKSIQRP
jgi:hypothetical protein